MLLIGCNLPYISLNMKQHSCKKRLSCVDKCDTSFNEVKPHSHFFSMVFASNGETSLLQKNCLEDKIVPEIKSNILEEIQYVNTCNYNLNEDKPHHLFFCITFALKGKIPLLQNDVCFVLLFHSYGRADCIHATMSLPKVLYTYTSTSQFFSVNCFTALSRDMGSFAHGANTFWNRKTIFI